MDEFVEDKVNAAIKANNWDLLKSTCISTMIDKLSFEKDRRNRIMYRSSNDKRSN